MLEVRYVGKVKLPFLRIFARIRVFLLLNVRFAMLEKGMWSVRKYWESVFHVLRHYGLPHPYLYNFIFYCASK